ncbi:MAG: TonB-dependent receptor [Steroidobacteraceae bacterium]|nr:TonB-dependent receptor [Steroidobacteraceae bacterium]MCW5571489.1 TonB-dependent receptor [Steroidobacteraceae bacterium]
MSGQMKCLMLLMAGIFTLPLHSGARAAEVGLEEVMVTATRREERLQDVPVAVSAVTGDTLSSIGAKELADYFLFVPSVNLANNQVGERGGQNIVIRGISNSRTVLTTDASMLSATTGFYLNDIPITPVDTQLFDVDRVEILRGPQGTLYGAGSLGGAIKMYHKRSNLHDFEAAVQGTVNTVERGGPGGDVSGMINVPILEGVLGARMVASYRTRDGFIDSVRIPLSNPVANTTYPFNSDVDVRPSSNSGRVWENANSATSRGARVALLYTPTDRLSVEAAMLWQETQSDDLTLYNLHYQRPMQEKFMLEPTSSEVTLTSLDVSYDFGPAVLTSLTGLYTRDYDEVVDYTFVTQGTRAPGYTYVPAASTLQTMAEWNTVTQEVRLQSNHRDSSNAFLRRLDWVVGAFWMQEDRDNWQIADAPGWGVAAPANPLPLANDVLSASDNAVKDSSKALFVDATFDVTGKLAVGAGIRFFKLSTELHGEAATPTTPTITDRQHEEDGHTPRFFARYSATDDLMLYGSYSEGFRIGGSTPPINFQTAPQCLPVVEENGLMPYAGGSFYSDSVETTELGVKSEFLRGRIRANVAAYHTDWSDLQQQIRLTGFPGSLCTQVLTANVGAAEVDGAELEFSTRATDRLGLSATVAYTDARIVDPGPGSALAKVGDRFPNVPEWTASLMADYSVPSQAFGGSTFFVHADARYISETSPQIGRPANPQLMLPEYTLVGLRGGFTFGDKPTTVTLFIDNLFDDDAFVNARGRVGVPTDVWVTPSMPRTIGLTVRKDF